VDDFARIRQALRDGLSARQIAKQLGVSRDTVRKAQNHAEPTPYTLSQPRPAPLFGPFRSFVDEIVAADETAPRKQRHTARSDSTAGKRSSLWSTDRVFVPRPTSATSTSTSRTVGGKSRF